MSTRVDILLEVTDKASSKIKGVNQGLQKDFGNLSKTLLATGVAAVGTFAAIEKILDLGKQGAQVNTLSQSFYNMGGELTKLQRASKGTVSDFALMNATNTLLIGTSGRLRQAFLDNSDELMEIAKAANALNPALGDTTFLYESLARGIKRSSPLILDNLGLVVKMEATYQDYADSIGKTVESLTTEEKQLALLNAVREAGVQLTKDAATVNTETADSFAALDAETANLGTAIKEILAPPLSAAAYSMRMLLTWGKQVDQMFQETSKSVIVTSSNYSEYSSRILQALVATKQITASQAEQIAMAIEAGRAGDYLQEKYGLLTEAAWRDAKAIELHNQMLGLSAAAALESAAALEETETQVLSTSEAFDKLYSSLNRDYDFAGIQGDFAFQQAGGEGLAAFEEQMMNTFLLLGQQGPEMVQFFEKDMVYATQQAELAQLKLQVELGNMTPYEAAKEAAKDMGMNYGEMVALMKDDTRSWASLLGGATTQLSTMQWLMTNMQGMTLDMFVNIHTTGRIPTFGKAAMQFTDLTESQHFGNKTVQSGITNNATGGPLGDVAVVGERGPEIVANGFVFTNQEAGVLAKYFKVMGIPMKGFATGGPLIDGTGGIPSSSSSFASLPSKSGTEPSYTKSLTDTSLGPPTTQDMRSALFQGTSGMVSASAAQQSASFEQEMGKTVSRMTAQINRGNAEVVAKLEELINKVLTEEKAQSAFKAAVRTLG